MIALPESYPWHSAQWARYARRAQEATLPHALLLSGPAGLGKLNFAYRFARFLLCDAPKEITACGRCRGCHLLSVGNHADFLHTAPEGDSRQIKIDQIRALSHFVSLSRDSGRYKVVLISNADTINRNAANSLLKTLEEPPPFSVILLITAWAASLPATLLSRCQRIEFRCPARAMALEWLATKAPDIDAETCLALARGAPLTALACSRDDLLSARRALFSDIQRLAEARDTPVKVAERWRQYAPEMIVGWLLSWLADVVKLKSKVTLGGLNNPDVAQGLQAVARRLDLVASFALYDLLIGYRRMQHAPLNPQLVLEDTLIALTGIFNVAKP